MTRTVLTLKTITETGDHYSSFDTFTTWSLNNYNSIANLATVVWIYGYELDMKVYLFLYKQILFLIVTY